MDKTVFDSSMRISEDAEITVKIEEVYSRNYETHNDEPQDKYVVFVDLSKFDYMKFHNFVIDFPNGENIEVYPGSLSYTDRDIHLYQEFGGR